MTKTIEIKDRALVDYIESLSYETGARKDIISFMLSNNMDTSSESFTRYHKEFEEFMVQYEEAKKQLEHMYITDELKKEMGGMVNWNLDFESGILSLRGNTNCKK
ncbi:MAG: hypothetical protein RR365_00925 [Bacteroides sp.]